MLKELKREAYEANVELPRHVLAVTAPRMFGVGLPTHDHLGAVHRPPGLCLHHDRELGQIVGV